MKLFSKCLLIVRQKERWEWISSLQGKDGIQLKTIHNPSLVCFHYGRQHWNEYDIGKIDVIVHSSNFSVEVIHEEVPFALGEEWDTMHKDVIYHSSLLLPSSAHFGVSIPLPPLLLLLSVDRTLVQLFGRCWLRVSSPPNRSIQRIRSWDRRDEYGLRKDLIGNM